MACERGGPVIRRDDGYEDRLWTAAVRAFARWPTTLRTRGLSGVRLRDARRLADRWEVDVNDLKAVCVVRLARERMR